MGILDKVVRIEKTIEKLAARKDGPVTALEIRRAILDDVEEHVAPAGRSRRVFPYDEIAIEVLAAPDARTTTSKRASGRALPARAELTAVLDPEEGLRDAIQEKLQQAGCERVGPLQLTVSVLRKPKPDWKADTLFRIEYARKDVPARAPAQRPTSAPATSEVRAAQIVVLEGTATKKTYALSGERTNVGRQAEVTDRHQRVVRRNQVVFLDDAVETNQTVSRAQAHIRFTPPDEYRLFDDHSSYGTRILRDGRMIDLPSGSPRGARLQAGDEVYFGRARVLFQMK